MLYESFNQFKDQHINEAKKINFKRDQLDINQLEEILKDRGEITIQYSNGQEYYIPHYLHVKGEIEDATKDQFPAYNNNGKRVVLKYEEVKQIE